MRILFLTNFYPPASRGGYERWCQEVASGLIAKRHKLEVLTSNFGIHDMNHSDTPWVHRELHLEMEFASIRNGIQFFTSRDKRRKENLALLRKTIADLKPDAALIWGMWNLSHQLPAMVEDLLPGRVAYYMGDYWPTLPNQLKLYWQEPAKNWVTSIPKSLLKGPALRILDSEEEPEIRFDRVLFPTTFMRDDLAGKGLAANETKVIYGAVDTRPFTRFNGSSDVHQNNCKSLLYVGRLHPEKGTHTAVEALAHLVNQCHYDSLKLIIVGEGEPEYEQYLKKLARDMKVDSRVVFSGPISNRELPKLYHDADIFLFTSIWPEPFGRVIVEAMASGLPVVGAATGGAAEIMVDNENALLFSTEDSTDLARQIERLLKDPELQARLAANGRQTALEKFDVDRMVDEIEIYLSTLAL